MSSRGIHPLADLAADLREHPNVAEKLHIASAYTPALEVSQGILIGDDAAAIPDGDGFLLLAAEGMMEGFIQMDPWFAGYCAVMVNLSDIAAMGGRPTAIVDVMWANQDSLITPLIWQGMRAASAAYGVPIVGGHTTRFPVERTPLLAAAALGKANRIISSFDAKPGHDLLMVVDLRGAYRGDHTVFWNASVDAPPHQLRGDLASLAEMADEKLLTTGKDISNGGILGTLAMLLATSHVGATVNLDALPMPPGVDLRRWLLSFPSYGYLFSTESEFREVIRTRFHARGLACEVIGAIESGGELKLRSRGETCVFAQIAAAASAPPATNP